MTPVRDREAMEQAIARGSDQLKQGKLDQAQRSFREALELDPANTKVLALLGLTYFRGNQFGEARPIYEQLVERAPTDASHRLNLGLVYLKLGDGEKAIAALEASRALDPSQGRAVSYLGLAYARGGRYAEAYRAFLMAGQNELAREIEINLTTAEREQIQVQLGRAPTPAPAADAPATARTPTPARAAPPSSPPPAAPVPAAAEPSEPRRVAHTIARTDSKPNRTSSDDLAAKAEAAVRSTRPTVPVPMPSSESQLFVLPRDPAAPQTPHPGQSMVSMAVAAATPATPAPLRAVTASGGTPPRPLSELATDGLVRPDDAAEVFELAAGGALVMRVSDRVMTRLDGVHVTGGDLAYEPATRRSRGHQTEERFDYGASPLYAVSGSGYLVAVPGDQTFVAVALDDDILYLREDLVFAFESSLRWENGNVPGLRGQLPIVQFRGDGALVLRSPRPLVRVKLPSSGVLLVDAARIAGWIGRVIPRAVVPAVDGPLGTMCIECTGEGVVLVEPAPADASAAAAREARASTPPALAPKPPPPPPAPTPAASTAIPDDGAALDTESAIDRLDEL